MNNNNDLIFYIPTVITIAINIVFLVYLFVKAKGDLWKYTLVLILLSLMCIRLEIRRLKEEIAKVEEVKIYCKTLIEQRLF
jgi:hypothetical protein